MSPTQINGLLLLICTLLLVYSTHSIYKIVILYYIIQYYTVLYYTIIILCYIILYYTILYNIILYYTVLYIIARSSQGTWLARVIYKKAIEIAVGFITMLVEWERMLARCNSMACQSKYIRIQKAFFFRERDMTAFFLWLWSDSLCVWKFTCRKRC